MHDWAKISVYLLKVPCLREVLVDGFSASIIHKRAKKGERVAAGTTELQSWPSHAFSCIFS
jgi:hypothetical protein